MAKIKEKGILDKVSMDFYTFLSMLGLNIGMDNVEQEEGFRAWAALSTDGMTVSFADVVGLCTKKGDQRDPIEGHGRTPNDALANLMKKMSHKKLVIREREYEKPGGRYDQWIVRSPRLYFRDFNRGVS